MTWVPKDNNNGPNENGTRAFVCPFPDYKTAYKRNAAWGLLHFYAPLYELPARSWHRLDGQRHSCVMHSPYDYTQ